MAELMTPEEIQAEREYVLGLKAEIDTSTQQPVAWTRLGRTLNIAHQTLQLFATGKYTGRNDIVADKVRRHRQFQDSMADYKQGRLKDPGFVEMPTARRVESLLQIAAMGDLTLCCAPPGTCKTFVARRFAQRTPGAVMVTMNPTTGRLTPFVTEVLKALGGIPRLSTAWSAEQVVERLKKTRTTLIIDEAGWMTEESLEMARSWADIEDIGLGICFLGNIELAQKIAGQRRSDQYARLNSRIASRMPADIDLSADIDLYLDAWGIEDAKVREMLSIIGTQPGAGGLREVKQTIKNAADYAMLAKKPLSAEHIVKAQLSRGKAALKVAA